MLEGDISSPTRRNKTLQGSGDLLINPAEWEIKIVKVTETKIVKTCKFIASKGNIQLPSKVHIVGHLSQGESSIHLEQIRHFIILNSPRELRHLLLKRIMVRLLVITLHISKCGSERFQFKNRGRRALIRINPILRHSLLKLKSFQFISSRSLFSSTKGTEPHSLPLERIANFSSPFPPFTLANAPQLRGVRRAGLARGFSQNPLLLKVVSLRLIVAILRGRSLNFKPLNSILERIRHGTQNFPDKHPRFLHIQPFIVR
nr:hypothetical protein Iba_chr07aCG14630 [Ipomoea batatas]